MIKNKINIVIFLLGITLFSVYNFIRIWYKNQAITRILTEKQTQILELKDLNAQLNRELQQKEILIMESQKIQEQLSKDLASKTERLAKVEELLNRAQREVGQLQQRVDRLESQNIYLVKTRKNILERLEKINQEYNSLLSRWQSIEELKKAIAQIKRKNYLLRRQLFRQKDKSLYGNRGYIIKDGISTLSTKIKIEVVPVE